MVTAGIWLIYAGVVLRALVRYADLPQRDLLIALLALYGLLLLVEPWIVERRAFRLSWATNSGFGLGQSQESAQSRHRLAAVYLFLQSSLVVGLFSLPPHVDFFAGLFVPLSLQAVLLLGRRLGFLCIVLFPLAMFVPLTANERGWPLALTMSSFAGGLCFLFGSYAHQVQKAERARSQNQRLLGELQRAHQQLQSYALQTEQLAAEQERNRLARELHDSVTQTVFSMNLTVQSARLLLDKDPDRGASQLERLEELAASAMGEIQTLVSQLRPPSIVEQGLPVALHQLTVRRQVHDRLRVDLEVRGERTPPDEVTAGLYRITQEALTNVVKHAGPTEVSIRLDLSGDQGLLEIEDHGLGFDPQTAWEQRGHLGLTGMVEQAREIGWNLSIDSRPGFGTRIRVAENPPEAWR